MSLRARAALLGAVLPLLLLGGSAVLIAHWAPRLPDPMALHWGLDGVNRVGPLTDLVMPFVILSLLICGPAIVAAVVVGGSARRLLVGLSAGLGAMMAGIAVSTTAIQLDVVNVYAVPAPGAAVVIAILAAVSIGTLAGLLAGADPHTPATEPVPADAERLPLPDGGAAAWSRALPAAPLAFPLTAIGLLLLGALVLGAVTGDWWLLLLVVLVAGVLVVALGWRMQVDSSGLTVSGALGWPRYQVPADEIVRADVVQVRPFADFGGWGMRLGRKGSMGFVTRTGEAVAVERSGNRRVVITVDDAARAAALLNTAADRARRSEPTSPDR